MSNYYLSYAEDLSTAKVTEKYPKATLIMKCLLMDYCLKFCCHEGTIFATIEKQIDSCVPAILWQIENGTLLFEEKQMQGYRQKEVNVKWNEENITALVFVMEGGQIGMPSKEMLNDILDGYEEHGFDPEALEDALDAAVKITGKGDDENASLF